MIITAQAAYNLCRDAHFSPDAAINGCGVMAAESNFDTTALGVNAGSNPTVDRGICQFNNYWHAEVTNDQAFDARQAIQQMARVSSFGTDFSQWSTWKAGAAQTEAAKMKPFEAMWEAAYVAPRPLPDYVEVAVATASATHFLRNGIAASNLISQDRDAIRQLAAWVG